jgi:hypothetical protein
LARITVTVHEALYVFIIISLWLLFRMTNVLDKSYKENKNTHFMFNNFYQILCHLWDNVEKCGIARQATDDNIIWCWKYIGMSGNLGKNMDICLYLILLLFHISNGYTKALECYVMCIACLVCGIIPTFFWLDWAELWETINSNACVTLHWNSYLIFRELQFFYIWWPWAHYVTIKIAFF